MRMADPRGSDVRLLPGQLLEPRAWPRWGDKSFKITPSGFVSTSTSLKIVHTSLTEKGAPCSPSVSFSLRFLTNLDYQVVPPSHAVPQRSKNPSLRRISALLLAANFFPSRGWTRSERNPVDTLSNDRAFFFTILPPSKRERRLLVRSQTRKRIERAVTSFLNWLGQTSQASPHTFDDLDEAVGNWSDVLYQEGDSTGSAGDGISGLQYFLSLLSRPSPFLSWRVLGVWRKNVLLAQAPPSVALWVYPLVSETTEWQLLWPWVFIVTCVAVKSL